jgi:hypothetical protein
MEFPSCRDNFHCFPSLLLICPLPDYVHILNLFCSVPYLATDIFKTLPICFMLATYICKYFLFYSLLGFTHAQISIISFPTWPHTNSISSIQFPAGLHTYSNLFCSILYLVTTYSSLPSRSLLGLIQVQISSIPFFHSVSYFSTYKSTSFVCSLLGCVKSLPFPFF